MFGFGISKRVKSTRFFFIGLALLCGSMAHAAPQVVEPTAVWGPNLGFGNIESAEVDGNRVVTFEASSSLKLGVWERDSSRIWARTASLDAPSRGSLALRGNIIALYAAGYVEEGSLYVYELEGS